jgi:hypothetical protein
MCLIKHHPLRLPLTEPHACLIAPVVEESEEVDQYHIEELVNDLSDRTCVLSYPIDDGGARGCATMSSAYS